MNKIMRRRKKCEGLMERSIRLIRTNRIERKGTAA
jgi:hypothetical protein